MSQNIMKLIVGNKVFSEIWLDGLWKPTVHILKAKNKISDYSKCQVVAIFSLSAGVDWYVLAI